MMIHAMRMQRSDSYLLRKRRRGASAEVVPATLGLRPLSDAAFKAPPGTVSIPVPGGILRRQGAGGLGNHRPRQGDCRRRRCPPGQAILSHPRTSERDHPRIPSTRLPRQAVLRFLLGPQSGGPLVRLSPFAPTNPCDRLWINTRAFPELAIAGGGWVITFGCPHRRPALLTILLQKDSAAGTYVAIDDVRLRTATEAGMAAAYEVDRGHLPSYDVSPRPEDGRNLALSVAKWEGRAGLPGKPFVIWAIGSSFTEFLGDEDPLIRAIRQRFPNRRRSSTSGTPARARPGNTPGAGCPVRRRRPARPRVHLHQRRPGGP